MRPRELLMFPGPVFYHELREVARRRRSFVWRTLIGLFLLYLLIAPVGWAHRGQSTGNDWEYSPGELAALGNTLFGNVLWLQAMVIMFLTPAFVAGAITEDRQRKILSYLLATPLSGAEIVLGKLAARLINLVVLVAVGLPVVSIALFLGGVEPIQVLFAYGISFSTLYFLAGLSIFVSTFSERPRDAILRTYLLELVWLFLQPIEQIAAQAGGGTASLVQDLRPITQWVIDSSPSAMLFRDWFSAGRDVIGEAAWMLGLQLLYGTALLAWATIRLRPLERGSRLWGLRWLDSLGASRPRRFFKRRACGDDPMIWKECSAPLASSSRAKTAAIVCVAMAAGAGLGYMVCILGIPAFKEVLDYGYGATGVFAARDNMSIAVRVITAVLYIISGLLLGGAAATGVTAEREKDTWTSLVSTPLEGPEILKGKILGAIWRVRHELAVLVFVWLLGLVCGAVHPLGFLLAILATSVYIAFIAILGTYFSLRLRSSVRAISATIAVLVFLNWGYLFCCAPIIMGPSSMIFTAGITPMVVTIAPFSARELNEFFQSGGPYHEGPMWIVTALVSLGFYGITSFALLHSCLNRFEIAVDRPRRAFSIYPRYVSRAGIAFPDEDGSSPEGIHFVEPDDEAGETWLVDESGEGDQTS
jgi:ABC-type Na+ efflux pump permease subunit